MKYAVHLCMYIGLLEWARSDQYQTVTNSIKKEIEGVSSGVTGIAKDIDGLVENYRNDLDKFNQVVGQQLSGSSRGLYQWYSQNPGKSPRQCLSAQRNLDMIRSRGNDTTARCLSRVESIVDRLRDKIKRLLVNSNRFIAAAGSLAAPCEVLDPPDECLSQAMDQVLQRKYSVSAILDRFKIYSKLKATEARNNFKLCRYLAKVYAAAHRNEMKTVDKCIMNDTTRQDVETESVTDSSLDLSYEMEKTQNSFEDFNLEE